MGTWALPNTKKKAEDLKVLLSKPFYCDEKATDKLYNLYGDDELFDEISDYSYEYGEHCDISFLVKIYIQNMLKINKKTPNYFNVKFEQSALKILKQIVKDIL